MADRPFRVLVCGSRRFRDAAFLFDRLDLLLSRRLPGVLVVHGACEGADRLAEDWADERGCRTEAHPADWKTHGRKAGPLRNQAMIEVADAVVAFRCPASVGTGDTIGRAVSNRKPLVVYEVRLTPAGLMASWERWDMYREGAGRPHRGG